MTDTLAQRFASNEITSLALTDALVAIGDRLGTPIYGMAQITVLQAIIGVGREMFWIPAVDMYPTLTAGAASAQIVIGSLQAKTLDFDQSANENAQFAIWMPKRWNLGTVTYQYLWSHPSTTTNFAVNFDLSGGAYANDDALSASFGSPVTVIDTGGTTDNIYMSNESGAVTIAGSPAAEEFVGFNLRRFGGSGGDTLAVDCRIHGIFLHITTNANTDD